MKQRKENKKSSVPDRELQPDQVAELPLVLHPHNMIQVLVHH